MNHSQVNPRLHLTALICKLDLCFGTSDIGSWSSFLLEISTSSTDQDTKAQMALFILACIASLGCTTQLLSATCIILLLSAKGMRFVASSPGFCLESQGDIYISVDNGLLHYHRHCIAESANHNRRSYESSETNNVNQYNKINIT